MLKKDNGEEILKNWQRGKDNSESESDFGKSDEAISSLAEDENDNNKLNYLNNNEAEQLQLGKEIGNIFKDQNIHPVFIFGSKGSGKTSILASLFRYIQYTERSQATITFNTDVFPKGEVRWDDQNGWAEALFFKKVFDYIGNRAPETTQEANPFFVPVTLTTPSGGDIKFAFLEGKGEWYQPDPNPLATIPFKKFKGFVQGVLQQFNAPASIIYVAPYTTGFAANENPKSDNLRKSDLGLLGALDEYAYLRKAFLHQDNHLFLVTKWDVYCGGISVDAFTEPYGDEIIDVLRERFPLAWAKYQNMNLSSIAQNKTFSAYCSGLIDDKTVISPAEEDNEKIDFYARKMWDWLYNNHTGLTLYPDVKPKPEGFFQKIITLLRGR